jgi:hypothetical protein
MLEAVRGEVHERGEPFHAEMLIHAGSNGMDGASNSRIYVLPRVRRRETEQII